MRPTPAPSGQRLRRSKPCALFEVAVESRGSLASPAAAVEPNHWASLIRVCNIQGRFAMFSTISWSLKSVLTFCIAVVLAGCVSPTTPKPVPATMAQPSPTQTSPTAEELLRYSDPFAYCTAVGIIDTPDERYTGPKMPDSIVQSMIKQGIVSADMPLEFQKHTVWRCMNNSVWVCNFGVNIPCLEKADKSQAPTSAMEDFCKMNPTAIGIPASMTGRATVYFWSCKNGKPEMVRQIITVDPQGYLAVYWHELTSK
jgi:hypothetical protein